MIAIINLIKDAEILKTLSFGEKMMGALQTAGIGMGVVFIVLIVLICVISIMGRMNIGGGKKGKDKAPAQEPPAPAPAAPVTKAAPAADNTGEIMAAIFAAISMMEGGNSFRIVNVQPVSASPSWTGIGLQEAFASRGSQLK